MLFIDMNHVGIILLYMNTMNTMFADFVIMACGRFVVCASSKQEELFLSPLTGHSLKHMIHWSTCLHCPLCNPKPVRSRSCQQITYRVITAAYMDLTQRAVFLMIEQDCQQGSPCTAQTRHTTWDYLPWAGVSRLLRSVCPCVFLCLHELTLCSLCLLTVSKAHQDHHRWLPPLFQSHSQWTGLERGGPGLRGGLP